MLCYGIYGIVRLIINLFVVCLFVCIFIFCGRLVYRYVLLCGLTMRENVHE